MHSDKTKPDDNPDNAAPEDLYAGMTPVKTEDRGWLRLKRALDLVGGALLAALLFPIMLAIAVAIHIESPGPVLFRQTRRGRGFRPFTILKFRSLRHGAPDPHVNYEMTETDPRITRVGAFLRRTSLDELPQIFNVLAGSMSLVGPRPLVENESVHCLKRHAERFLMRPGITGLQQIEVRNAVGLDERSDWDVTYVRQWSNILDLNILMKTPARVFGKESVYPDAKDSTDAQ